MPLDPLASAGARASPSSLRPSKRKLRRLLDPLPLSTSVKFNKVGHIFYYSENEFLSAGVLMPQPLLGQEHWHEMISTDDE